MTKELTCKQAIEEYLEGKKITVSVESDMGALSMEEISRLNKAGAKFLITAEEGPESPPPTDKNKQAKQKVDTGKILALKKAGWTQAAIAEEMGVSAATISAALKKIEKEKKQ